MSLVLQNEKNIVSVKKNAEKFGGMKKTPYLCIAIQNKGCLLRVAEIILGYGVMVTQQILVLFFLVRVRVSQQRRGFIMKPLLLFSFNSAWWAALRQGYRDYRAIEALHAFHAAFARRNRPAKACGRLGLACKKKRGWENKKCKCERIIEFLL